MRQLPSKLPPPPPPPPATSFIRFPLLRRQSLESFFFSALSSASSSTQIKQSHALLLKLHLHHSNLLISKLLRRLSNLNTPFSSYHLLAFSQVPNPNSFLFTSLLRCSPNPFQIYTNMRTHQCLPLSFTFSALLKSSQTVETGSQVHAQTIFFGGFDSDLLVQNTLIDFYVRSGDVGSARKVFDEMSVRDIVSWTLLIVAYTKNGDMGSAESLFGRFREKDEVAWTAMVTGYVQNARPKEALDVFERMEACGVRIDEVSLVGAISAVAQLGAANRVGWIREVAERAGIGRRNDNVVVGTAMIDMYSKCGLIDEAHEVFDSMPEKNVYSYSAMITGFATHGRASEAIALFEELVEKTTIKPNWVTFIGLFTACSHGGKVEQGRHYFDQMKNRYGITPSADHYNCMVDLLGRAGLVEEALELVRSMPMEAHGGVWGALLNACRIHGNTEIAEIAANHLFELEPNGVGNYVLLSNIYASAGMWAKVSKVRKLMQRRRLKKIPSTSWMEDKDGRGVHEFFAGDNMHPRTREIKEALEVVLERLKVEEGYQPVLSSVAYNVSDDEKERILKEHSEKLALAYGILTTEVGGTIRIMKNVRMCQDCHEVMRMVSKVMSREIVVRDNMRFHHFRIGECSCGGFW